MPLVALISTIIVIIINALSADNSPAYLASMSSLAAPVLSALRSALSAVAALPAAPVEPAEIAVLPERGSSSPLGIRVSAPPAPTAADVILVRPTRHALPLHALELLINPRAGLTFEGPEEAAVFARFFARHLRISVTTSAGIYGFPHTLPQSRMIITARLRGVVHVAIAPSCWKFAKSVTIEALTLSNESIGSSVHIPVTVTVGACHALTPAGRVFAAAEVGDAKRLVYALTEGGSTEEEARGEPVSVSASHEFRIANYPPSCWSRGTTPCALRSRGTTRRSFASFSLPGRLLNPVTRCVGHVGPYRGSRAKPCVHLPCLRVQHTPKPIYLAAYLGHATIVKALLACPGIEESFRTVRES